MSDFTSNFWSIFVAAVTLGSILACALLLWFSGKVKVSATGDNTTGHVWDGDLREMNNPLPMWWVGLFVITIVFALAYLMLFPGLGTYAGKLGWTSKGEHQAEMQAGREQVEPLYAKYRSMKPEEVAQDPQAMAMGERVFMNSCAQ
jgi:cytochrome c oxidase cbb3-type subunit 3